MENTDNKTETYKEDLNISADIQNRVFEYLESVGVTDSEYAKSIGVSRQNVSKWRTGRSHPASRTLLKILTIYNEVNLSWLVTGKGDMKLSAIHERREDILNEYDNRIRYLEEENEMCKEQIRINIDIIKLLEERIRMLKELVERKTGIPIKKLMLDIK